MALADHKPARKRGHLEHVITTLTAWLHDPTYTAASIARILTTEGHPTEGHHVVQWRNRNVKGANK